MIGIKRWMWSVKVLCGFSLCARAMAEGTWCVGRISNWSSTITGALKSLQRTRGVRGLPCSLLVDLCTVKDDGICWMKQITSVKWMHCFGLLRGSTTLYFLQNLNMGVEKGEDVLGSPALCSKGCLFLLQFSEWWRCVFWAEDVEPRIPVSHSLL